MKKGLNSGALGEISQFIAGNAFWPEHLAAGTRKPR